MNLLTKDGKDSKHRSGVWGCGGGGGRCNQRYKGHSQKNTTMTPQWCSPAGARWGTSQVNQAPGSHQEVH